MHMCYPANTSSWTCGYDLDLRVCMVEVLSKSASRGVFQQGKLQSVNEFWARLDSTLLTNVAGNVECGIYHPFTYFTLHR